MNHDWLNIVRNAHWKNCLTKEDEIRGDAGLLRKRIVEYLRCLGAALWQALPKDVFLFVNYFVLGDGPEAWCELALFPDSTDLSGQNGIRLFESDAAGIRALNIKSLNHILNDLIPNPVPKDFSSPLGRPSMLHLGTNGQTDALDHWLHFAVPPDELPTTGRSTDDTVTTASLTEAIQAFTPAPRAIEELASSLARLVQVNGTTENPPTQQAAELLRYCFWVRWCFGRDLACLGYVPANATRQSFARVGCTFGLKQLPDVEVLNSALVAIEHILFAAFQIYAAYYHRRVPTGPVAALLESWIDVWANIEGDGSVGHVDSVDGLNNVRQPFRDLIESDTGRWSCAAKSLFFREVTARGNEKAKPPREGDSMSLGVARGILAVLGLPLALESCGDQERIRWPTTPGVAFIWRLWAFYASLQPSPVMYLGRIDQSRARLRIVFGEEGNVDRILAALLTRNEDAGPTTFALRNLLGGKYVTRDELSRFGIVGANAAGVDKITKWDACRHNKLDAIGQNRAVFAPICATSPSALELALIWNG